MRQHLTESSRKKVRATEVARTFDYYRYGCKLRVTGSDSFDLLVFLLAAGTPTALLATLTAAALLAPAALLATLTAAALLAAAALAPAALLATAAALAPAALLATLAAAALLATLAAALTPAPLTALLGLALARLVVSSKPADAITILWSFHGVIPFTREISVERRCACLQPGLSGLDALNSSVAADYLQRCLT
jgi:hypothetical protein